MKIFHRNTIASVLVLSFAVVVFGLVGPITALAATTPSLGLSATYGVLANNYTNTVAGTTVNGDVGFTTGPAVAPLGVHTNYGSGAPYATAGANQNSALVVLSSEPCTFTFAPGAINLSTDTTHGPIGVYTPGVYCSSGAMSVGTAGITLSGAGTYIFRPVGALTSVDNSVVTLSGACANDVFWTASAATTLGANTTFVGNIMDVAGITMGAGTVLTGRALAWGGTITTDTNTITVPSVCSVTPPPAPVVEVDPLVTRSGYNTITVLKQVINDNGRTTTSFPLFIDGVSVVSGQSVSLSAGIHTITETSSPNYKTTFSGDCNASGQDNLGGLDTHNDVCVIVNDDIGAPVVTPPIPPLIDVVKVPSPLALPDGPGSVIYTYTAKNIGTVPMTSVTMVGDTCSPIIQVSGDTNGDSKLDVNETWVYKCTATLTLTHKNTVVATGWANGLVATDVASATVVVGVPIVPPLIHITKVPNPLALTAGGGMVTYTKKVTNPGIVALSNVTVTDDKCSPVQYISGDTNNDSKLDPSETWTYTCKSNLTQTTANTATAEGEGNGLIARDLALATVVVAAAVPALPNTGFSPQDNSSLLGVIILSGIFAISMLFFFIRRKQTN